LLYYTIFSLLSRNRKYSSDNKGKNCPGWEAWLRYVMSWLCMERSRRNWRRVWYVDKKHSSESYLGKLDLWNNSFL